jgi:hypothetical protein
MAIPFLMEEFMHIKKYSYMLIKILVSTIFILFLIPTYTYANSNMDGGGSGGGSGSGTNNNYYSTSDYGVRITVIDTRTNRRADGTLTIDYHKTGKGDKTVYDFGKVSKLEYMGVAGYSNPQSLSWSLEDYTVNSLGKTVSFKVDDLPVIISSNTTGNSDIDEIKRYFNNRDRLIGIAARSGIDYETMICGNYKLIFEPIIYLTFEGDYIAMTAHEAALFDMMLGGSASTGGQLRTKFVSFTHKNLPLAIFLEKKDLGVNRWTDSKYNRVTNGDILKYLGIGILSFSENTVIDNPVDPDIDTGAFTYRPNTDVITSVEVSAGSGGWGATSDNPITVQFSGELIPTTQVSGIVIPAGGSRLVWFKWHTPSVTVKTTSYIYVNVSGAGSATGTIKVTINPIQEKEPPNPTADDKKPYGWSNVYLPSIPAFPKIGALSSFSSPRKSLSWHTYTCTKRYVFTGSYYTDSEGNELEDGYGNPIPIYETVYDFTTNYYSATLVSTNAALRPDSNTSITNKSITEVKSGYGVELRINSSVTSSGGAGTITGIQTAVTYFPEYSYANYRRISKMLGAALNSTLEFPVNLYSIKGSRIHFLPIWYPDKEYKVYIETLDAWTPAGMLCDYTTASIQVKGSMWDDWNIGILPNN